MARAIEVPVVAKKGTLARSIEGEAATAFRSLGRSSGAVAPLGRMLGKIRADADEFTKSIEASNARVIAFGASVGVINGISNAFKELVRVTVSVEKSLTDINVVLNANQSQLTKFGDGLFKVAKNTAQSFDVVAEAATEFARQGLSIEETLKRTNDALILTRLTGLKAAESVKGLTAATNGFAKAGLSTTQIINKLAAVDVKFAVSADDLIAALSRTGAVAQDAGLSMDELIGMVTAAQQTTARGGAVIGNAFKTIFTRVQRPETLRTLRELKIAVDDASGAALPASKVLQNLANSYDGLSRSAKDAVNQQVAGVFQINILKAAVGDLQKQNSIAARATAVSANATDQAARKNEMLNKTIAALTTQTGLALTELAKKIGDIALAPGMRDLIGSFKALVEGTTGVLDGEGTGSRFAQGLLKGIGNVLTGPGLIVIGGVFIKLFKDLTVFGMNSLKNLLGLNNAAKQQAALQQGIGTLLQTNTAYQTQIAAAAGNVNKQAAITQRFLQQEIAMRQQAAALTSGMAGAAFMGGFRVDKAGDLTKKRRGLRGMVPGLAPTEVPNFMLASAMASRMNKLGYKGAMGRVNFAEGTAREALIGRAIGASSGRITASDISTKGQGRIPAGPDFPGGDAKPGMIHPGGSSDIAKRSGKGFGPGQATRAASQGGIHYSGYEAFPSGHGAGPLHYGQQHFSSSSQFGQVVQGINPFPAGSPKHMGIAGAIERVRASGLPGRGHFTGIPVNFSDSNLRKEFYHRVARHGGIRPKFSKKGNDIDIEPADEILAHLNTLSKEQVQKIMVRAANRELQASINTRGGQIPSYAPIGDAIKREKHQVGGLLGINPSQVKTKVIQNTALRSSFNPGGFGVISPTIGQNNFADAARMHRGEDLRTANLPNFMTRLPIPGIDPLGGRKPLSMTPVGYTETIKAIITGVEDEPAKKLGTSTAKALTRPTSPMATGLSRDDILGRTRAIRDERGLKTLAAGQPGGLGAGAMNAFMGYSIGTMFDPMAQDFLGVGAGVLPGAIGGGMLGRAGSKSVAARLAGTRMGTSGVGKKALKFIPGIGTALSAILGGVGGGMGSGNLKFQRQHGEREDFLPAAGQAVADALPEFLRFGAESSAEAVERIKEQFRSQINFGRRSALDELTANTRAAARADEQSRLTEISERRRLGLTAAGGGLSSIDVARRSAGIRRRRAGAADANKRQQFISSASTGLIDKMGDFSYEGGGPEELRIRNLIRENLVRGNFSAVDEFFRMSANPEMRGPGMIRGLRKGVGIDTTTDLDKLSPIEKRGFAQSGFIDNLTGVMRPETASKMGGGNIAEAIKGFAQSDNFQKMGTTVLQTAEAFRELEKSMAFDEEVAALNDRLDETAARMENVNRFTSGFSSSFASAFSNITTGASSAKNAMMDFGISVFGAINKIQSERIAQSLTGALFPEGGKSEGFLKGLFGGNQKGGLIKAQNGMYISGGRTGDKNPALLEDGEYVLNRNAVKALGGPSAIDGLNFGIAPRFQSGGRLASPIAAAGVRSSSLNKIIEENEFLPPMAGMGTALGGGGSSVRLGITDPRLSGFAHANDPVLQNVRADIQKYHEKQRQKKFESQAKKDQLLQTIVGAVVSSGVAFGVDKAKGAFKNKKLTKQALADEGAVFGEGFDFGPLMTAPSGGGKINPSTLPAPGFNMIPGRPAAPGFNMIPGASTAPGGGMLQAGQQMGMMKLNPRAVAEYKKFLNVGERLRSGMDFTKAVSPLGSAGRSTQAIANTFRKAGIKPGDRPGMAGYLESLAGEIADLHGIIRSRSAMRTGVSNPAIDAMMRRGALMHDRLGGGPGVEPIKIRKDQRGGYIDNIPAMLTGGEFVVNPSTVRRHGSAFFNKLNRGGRIGYQTGGIVGDQQFVPAQGDTQNNNNNKTQNENNATSNTTINITVNGSSGESNSDGENASTEQRQMATQLQDAVLTVLKQQKRTGGMLRDVTSNDQ